MTEAQQRHQEAVDQQIATASASQAQVEQLTQEIQQQRSTLAALQQQLQHTQQQKVAVEGQVEAWRAQHAQQAPQVAELLRERQAWIEDLQRERAAASAAASAAEVCVALLLKAVLLDPHRPPDKRSLPHLYQLCCRD